MLNNIFIYWTNKKKREIILIIDHKYLLIELLLYY